MCPFEVSLVLNRESNGHCIAKNVQRPLHRLRIYGNGRCIAIDLWQRPMHRNSGTRICNQNFNFIVLAVTNDVICQNVRLRAFPPMISHRT